MSYSFETLKRRFIEDLQTATSIESVESYAHEYIKAAYELGRSIERSYRESGDEAYEEYVNMTDPYIAEIASKNKTKK